MLRFGKRKNVLLDPESRYAFVYVPKVASSTILYTLHVERARRNGEPPPDRDKGGAWMHRLAEHGLPDLLALADSSRQPYTFAFVRNPYSRLLSGYRDKIGGPEERRNRFLKGIGLPKEPIDFEGFVHHIATLSKDKLLNWHFAPQVQILEPAHVHYDSITHMEDLGETWPKVTSEIFGDPIPLEGFNPHPTGAATKYLDSYTPEMIEIVNGRFAEDFEAFGYPTV